MGGGGGELSDPSDTFSLPTPLNIYHCIVFSGILLDLIKTNVEYYEEKGRLSEQTTFRVIDQYSDQTLVIHSVWSPAEGSMGR